MRAAPNNPAAFLGATLAAVAVAIPSPATARDWSTTVPEVIIPTGHTALISPPSERGKGPSFKVCPNTNLNCSSRTRTFFPDVQFNAGGGHKLYYTTGVRPGPGSLVPTIPGKKIDWSNEYLHGTDSAFAIVSPGTGQIAGLIPVPKTGKTTLSICSFGTGAGSSGTGDCQKLAVDLNSIVLGR
jgi:hypothetical protein